MIYLLLLTITAEKKRKLSIADRVKLLNAERNANNKSDEEEPSSAVSFSQYQADDEHKTPVPGKDLKRKAQVFERPKRRKVDKTPPQKKFTVEDVDEVEEVHPPKKFSSDEDEDDEIVPKRRSVSKSTKKKIFVEEDDESDE